jgi:hypothetical protein
MIKKYKQFIKEELNVSKSISDYISSEEDKTITDLGYLLSNLSKKDYDFDFVDVDKTNSDNLTFLPTNRIKNSEDPYTSNNRMSIKTGRLMKKILDSLNEETILEDVHISIGYYKDEVSIINIDSGYFEKTWIPEYKYKFLDISITIEGDNVNETHIPISITRWGKDIKFTISENYGHYDDLVNMIGTFKIKVVPVYTNKLLEDITHMIRASRKIIQDGFKNMNIVEGEDIRKWYNEKSYTKNQKSTLGKSCMKYEGTSQFLDIYCENSSVVKLLIYLDDEGKLLARALLWTLSDGKKYMDRCYYNDETLNYIFSKWAIDNNYYYYNGHSVYYNGEYADCENFKVNLEKSLFNFYPYMDSFKYLYSKDNVLSISPLNLVGLRKLEDTEGGWY